MDIKVNQVNQTTQVTQTQHVQESDGSFKFMLASNIEEAELAGRLNTLMEQIEAYKNNGQEKGAFVTAERVLIDHYVKGMGKDQAGNTVTLDYDMIRSGVENAVGIYGWLQTYGLTTTPLMEYVSTPAGSGMGLIELLSKAAEGAEIRLSTRARELIVEDGRITGVIAEAADGSRITYHANKAVVLATGSFSSNGEMVAKYQKIGTGLTANIPSNNPAGNRGDGIVPSKSTRERSSATGSKGCAICFLFGMVMMIP